MADLAVDPRDQVVKVAERLVRDYGGQVSDEMVRDLVEQAYAELAQAKVTQFVPVLVDRTVRERIRRQRAPLAG